MTGLSGPTLTSLVLAAGMVTLGCSDGGTPPATTNIAKVSGDEQVATVGQALANPLQVQATDGGAPSAGTTVTWSTTTPAGSLVPSSGPTDANGIASTGWTLGTVSGIQRATATLSSGSLQTFTATAAADAPTTLVKVPGGDGQTGEIGSQLDLPVQAKVTDQHGNGVQGVAVGWSATGATPSSPSVISDAAGLSSVNVTVDGPVGPIVITATAGTLSGSPVTFNATAVVTAAPPTSIAITVGDDFFSSDRNQTTSPAVDTVAVGGTVTWTWAPTSVSHNVTSNSPPGFTSSPDQAAGATYDVVFPTAGTYRYYCSLHATAASTSGMVGRIVVK